MITDADIDKAIDLRIDAFDRLAKAEDDMGKVAEMLDDLKEGSKGYMAVQEDLKSMQPTLTALKRAYVKAGWEVDRIYFKLLASKK